MAEKKRKIDMFGHAIDVAEVPIVEEEERFLRYTLEDGTVLMVKNVATAALRVEGQYLPDGKPVYIVLSNPVVSVESSPLTKDASPVAQAAPAKKVN
jgi:hypothetical protein